LSGAKNFRKPNQPTVIHHTCTRYSQDPTGYVKGLRAKSDVTVNIWFESGALKKAELMLDKHLPADELTIIYNGEQTIIKLEPGIITALQ